MENLCVLISCSVSYKIFFNLMDKPGITEVELTILIRSTLVVANKIDKEVEIPELLFIECLSASAFTSYSLLHEKMLTKTEFLNWCVDNREVSRFSHFWINKLTPIPLKENELWLDHDFSASNASLYIDEHSPPLGSPSTSFVFWKRCSEIVKHKSTVKVFLDGFANKISGLKAGIMSRQWLANAFAILQTKEYVLRRLFVPTGQEDRVSR
jgi:hypothetical protein